MRTACLLLLGFLADLLFGDPERLGAIHPVVWMGRAIARLERRLREIFPKTESGELHAGRVLAFLLPVGTLMCSFLVLLLLRKLFPPAAFLLELLWCAQALAAKDLRTEVMRVHAALEKGGLHDAREALSRIVGRDTDRLDEESVIRAAVETTAENFSDGVVAPLFYMAIGGAPLALCYKAINTMDSMVGYRNDRYLYFGRAAARLDDAANYLPARIAALFLIASAKLGGENATGAYRIWRRDRRKHASPNAAQCEAAAAGALGIRLGGPTPYFGELHDKPYIGDDTRPPMREDIPRACRMEAIASALCVLVCVLARVLSARMC